VSNTAALAVSKFSPGANGQVLTTAGGISQWAVLGANGLINDVGTNNLNAGNSSSTAERTTQYLENLPEPITPVTGM